MTHRLVFRIGPLPVTDRPPLAFFVWPPRDESEFFAVASDAEGLAAVAAAYPGERLRTAPDLDPASDMRRVDDLTLDEADAILATVTEMAAPEHFAGVTEATSIARLSRAGMALAAAAPWQAPSGRRMMAVELTGAVDGPHEAAVVSPEAEGAPGLSLYRGRGALARVAEVFAERGAMAAIELDVRVLSLQEPPDYAARAMRMAAGGAVLCVPARVEAGARVAVDDADLLALAAVAEAVAQVAGGAEVGSSCVAAGGLGVRATATMAAGSD